MSSPPYRILIIDDSPEDRAIYRRLLCQGRAGDFIIHEADACELGLALLRQEPIDCILLDFRLPDCDGLEMLAGLLDAHAPPPVAIVMLTGQGNERVVVEAMKRGVQDYLVKHDLSAESLQRSVRAAIERVKLLQQVETQRRELERLATTDEMTGLYNRRFFMQRLDEEINRAQRYRTPLSLLLIDVDHFKRVNDRFGHLIGDQVLVAVAQVLKHQRETDIVARFGGEEFIILLPNTGLSGAATLAERVRLMISARPTVTSNGETITVTCSLGVAELQPGADARAFLAAADRALYRAKDAGRNRVCLSDD